MRIRKNAQLALRGFSQGSAFPARQAHACQLNQSPWDVVSFGAPERNGPNPLLPLQFEGEDSFTGNGSLGDSMGAVESVASMMHSDERAAADVAGLVIDDNDMIKVFGDNEEDKFGLEGEEDRRHERNGATKGKRVVEKQAPLSRRGRPRSAKKGSSSANSNPYEFYYYSGFGPLWGKRRGERGGGGEVSKNDTKEAEHNDANGNSTHQNNTSSSSSSQINGNTEEFDFIDDEDDEEYEDNGRRKRMRKPVKARSLKSLM